MIEQLLVLDDPLENGNELDENELVHLHCFQVLKRKKEYHYICGSKRMEKNHFPKVGKRFALIKKEREKAYNIYKFVTNH